MEKRKGLAVDRKSEIFNHILYIRFWTPTYTIYNTRPTIRDFQKEDRLLNLEIVNQNYRPLHGRQKIDAPKESSAIRQLHLQD